MTETWASGSWHVKEGEADAFIAAWTDFLEWSRENRPGFRAARLLRDEKDPQHFLSLVEWDDPESRVGWQTSEGFASRWQACRDLCDDFHGSDYQQQVEI